MSINISNKQRASIVGVLILLAYDSGISWLGTKGMVIALFLIGSNISLEEAKKAGIKSFAQGILLWLVIGISSFIVLTSSI